ncbi:hypothetical protein [Pseudomonas sp.]|uniref:hypothetical protein n=1 Tax=Pseudomonas sp. TaxID=306 RepID=UPI003FD88AD8
MASINSTQTTAAQVLRPFDAAGQFLFQSEKISCSDASKASFDPLNLVGKLVSFHQYIPAFDEEPSSVCRFDALVLGFSLGISTYNLKDSLYLWQVGYDYREFVDVSLLTVVSVLSVD